MSFSCEEMLAAIFLSYKNKIKKQTNSRVNIFSMKESRHIAIMEDIYNCKVLNIRVLALQIEKSCDNIRKGKRLGDFTDV